jgi:RecJ-like exonuclease
MGLNYDLVPLAITGAVGDLQDSKDGKLVGLNQKILMDGISNGFIEAFRDIRLFGKQTRPVYKMLEYTFDPFLPGISGNERASLEFMEKAGVAPKNHKARRWIDLTFEEKVSLTSEIVKLCIHANYPVSMIKRLVGEAYILVHEEEGTELRDAMEFSTLLNATARYGYEEIGLKVCMGDRADAYKKARTLLQNHRRKLSDGLKLIDEIGIEEMENLQYFHAEDKILDTIVGIVAGMCFFKANYNKPIIAFANKEDGGIKVSARATQSLVARGVHLANALKFAAEKVGGVGGGHKIAAGATIPTGSEQEFLRELNIIISKQMGKLV